MANRNIRRKELKVAFLEALEKSLGVMTVAAKSVGLTRATVYNWMADDPKFKEAVDAVNDIQCDFVESKLLKLIGEDDPSAVIFYLRTKGKHRGYTERLDVNADVNATLTLPELREKDREYLQKKYGAK